MNSSNTQMKAFFRDQLSQRDVAGLVLLFLGVLFFLFVFPHGIHGDAYYRYENLLHLLNTGEFKVMNFSYVGPLFSSPLLLFGHLFKDGYWWLSRFNTFLFLFAGGYYFKNTNHEWTLSERIQFLLLLFCASMFPKHVTDYYSEIFTVSFMAMGIFLILQKRNSVLALLMIVSSVWNTPGTAMGGLLVCCTLALREKKLRLLAGVPLIVGGMITENFLKYGEWFPNPYISNFGAKNLLPYSGGPGFSYPIFFGVLSVFFSYGKGLIFFTPGLWYFPKLIKWRGTLLESFLFLGCVYIGGLLLIFPRWWCWTGDYFWGPRYYLVVSLLSVFALQMRKSKGFSGILDRGIWITATALSVWVGCQGITFGQSFLEDCYKRGNELEFICYYVPEYSVLWRPFIVHPAVPGRMLAFVIYFSLVGIWLLGPAVVEFFRELKKWTQEFLRKEVFSASWKI